MTEMREDSEQALDTLFAEARAATPRPDDALVARILADAARTSAARAAAAAPARRGRGLLGALGGWPGFAGLATAGVAGLAIGFFAPGTLETLSGGYLAGEAAYDVVDFLPAYGAILDEG